MDLDLMQEEDEGDGMMGRTVGTAADSGHPLASGVFIPPLRPSRSNSLLIMPLTSE